MAGPMMASTAKTARMTSPAMIFGDRGIRIAREPRDVGAGSGPVSRVVTSVLIAGQASWRARGSMNAYTTSAIRLAASTTKTMTTKTPCTSG